MIFDRVSKKCGKWTVLNNVSFVCLAGTIAGLLGQNGAPCSRWKRNTWWCSCSLSQGLRFMGIYDGHVSLDWAGSGREGCGVRGGLFGRSLRCWVGLGPRCRGRYGGSLSARCPADPASTVSREIGLEQVSVVEPERVIPACSGLFGYTSAPTATAQYRAERAEHRYLPRAHVIPSHIPG